MKIQPIFPSFAIDKKKPQKTASFGYGIEIPSKEFYNARKMIKDTGLRQKITVLEKFLKLEKPKLSAILDEITKSAGANPAEIPSIKLKLRLKKGHFPQISAKLNTDKDFSPIIIDYFNSKGEFLSNEDQLIKAVKAKSESGLRFSTAYKLRDVSPEPPQQAMPKIRTIPYEVSPLYGALSVIKPFIAMDEKSYQEIVSKIFNPNASITPEDLKAFEKYLKG